MANDAALAASATGELLRLSRGDLRVEIAPQAGGRLASVAKAGVEWLVGHEHDAAPIAWGCYPMLPWAGRIRRGRFAFDGRHYTLPLNLGAHAIHGVGFALPWQVERLTADTTELSLELPQDKRWPLGGRARQRIALEESAVHLEIDVTATAHAMPVVVGWHPWFRKPDHIEFSPRAAYPRDDDGIAVPPPADPPPGPWDDCFINREPVTLRRAGQILRLTSSAEHWVVFDEPAHATCVEPQTGPPDAFNLDRAVRLAPGATSGAWFRMEWV